jgi:type III pantothenate kinase
MLLAVDVGNTQTVAGLIDDGAIVDHWRMATVRHRTGDEIAGLLAGFLALRDWRTRDVIDEVGIASVVPRLTAQWTEMCAKHLGLTPFIVGPGTKTGIRILTKNPAEVGADRVVNAVAAFVKYGGPCIVVDCGTATTFDVISPEGDYLGGVIAPGIEVSMEALMARAAKLAIRAELGHSAKVVATGGLAEMIARHTKVVDDVDPFLTLRGIDLVMRRQSPR